MKRIRIIAVVALSLSACASSAPPLETKFMHAPLTIDGNETDWDGLLAPMPNEDRNLAFAAVSDGQDVYIAFATSDQQTVGQMVAMGLTLWFDPAGGSAKTVGIRFPVGLGESGLQSLMRGQRGRPDAERLDELFVVSTSAVEIVRDGAEEGQRFRPGDVRGLDVAASLTMGTLFYELRVPLKPIAGAEVAVDLAEGAMLGFGMETPKIDMEAMREQMMQQRGGGGGRPGGGGMPGGGMMGSGGGMPGGGMPGGGMRGGPSMPQPVKIWRQIDVYSVEKAEQ
ncbi:MAG: hypothetical protein RhofKO_22640 [Rhodothermales bacterium]